jgi:hypothetical protein
MDCPIANQYAPEIQRIVKLYGSRGVRFQLVYEDQDVSQKDLQRHTKAFGITALSSRDPGHRLARRMGVSVSPTAVLALNSKIAYSGRIDDQYFGVGNRSAIVHKHDLRDALDAVLAGKLPRTRLAQPVGCRLF